MITDGIVETRVTWTCRSVSVDLLLSVCLTNMIVMIILKKGWLDMKMWIVCFVLFLVADYRLKASLI